jgi:RNA polymerase sigma-70 factor, ECF subfamily
MPTTDQLTELLSRLLRGESDAADQLFHSYAGRLAALARRTLDPRLLARVDPEDVVQSALRSFFVRASAGEFEFGDPERLWGLLAVLTVRKCHRQADLHFAQQRDVRREAAPQPGSDSDPAAEVVWSREPTPDEAACLTDTVREVMARLASPLKRQVFELTLQGFSPPEIARQLSYYERGVLRVRAEIRSLLAGLAAG